MTVCTWCQRRGRFVIWEPEDRWAPRMPSTDVVFLSGPDRVSEDEQPDPTVKPRPAGFVLPEPGEPKTWEGDNG